MENTGAIRANQKVIVVKQKSKASAVLLALFFGPFGLLYTSFLASIIMMIVVPILLMILIAIAGSLFGSSILPSSFILIAIICILYFPICSIVAYSICSKNNKKKVLEAQSNVLLTKSSSIVSEITLYDVISFVLVVVFVFCLLYMFYDKLILKSN